MSLSVDEKIRVAHALDDLGVHLIEAGFPSSNPKEEALFGLLSKETFGSADIAAFGMTRRRDGTAEQDAGLRTLAESFAPVCTLVGKTGRSISRRSPRSTPRRTCAWSPTRSPSSWRRASA